MKKCVKSYRASFFEVEVLVIVKVEGTERAK